MILCIAILVGVLLWRERGWGGGREEYKPSRCGVEGAFPRFRCDSSRHEVWQYSICELFLTLSKDVTVVLLICRTCLCVLRNLSEDGEVGLVALGTALEDCDKVRVCICVHLLPVHLQDDVSLPHSPET